MIQLYQWVGKDVTENNLMVQPPRWWEYKPRKLLGLGKWVFYFSLLETIIILMGWYKDCYIVEPYVLCSRFSWMKLWTKAVSVKPKCFSICMMTKVLCYLHIFVKHSINSLFYRNNDIHLFPLGDKINFLSKQSSIDVLHSKNNVIINRRF